MDPLKILVIIGLLNVLPLLAGAIRAIDPDCPETFRQGFVFAHMVQISIALMGALTIGLFWFGEHLAIWIMELMLWLTS